MAPFQILNTWKNGYEWIPIKVEDTNIALFSLVYLSSLFTFPFPNKILLSKRMLQIQRLVPPRAWKKTEPLQSITRISARSLHSDLTVRLRPYSSTAMLQRLPSKFQPSYLLCEALQIDCNGEARMMELHQHTFQKSWKFNDSEH